MQVFKAALRIFFRHPAYAIVYIMCLSMLGVFISMSTNQSTSNDFEQSRPHIAIIDRDMSQLSQELITVAQQHGELISITDSQRALQDATAQNQASYILIVPEGFERDFMEAAHANTPVPTLETIVSYQTSSGPMMDTVVNEYLALYHSYAAALPDQSPEKITAGVKQYLNAHTQVEVQQAQAVDSAPQYLLYLQFSAYPIILSMVVCTSSIFLSLKQDAVRKRSFASSSTSFSMSIQIALACVIIALLVLVWLAGLGLVVFNENIQKLSLITIMYCLLCLAAFCAVGLSMGFLLGQITQSMSVINAVANISGLVFSFLGGSWVPLDFVGEPIKTIAKFLPVYYYNSAVSQALGFSNSAEQGFTFIQNLGVLLLFSAALFAIGFAISRQKHVASGGIRLTQDMLTKTP